MTIQYWNDKSHNHSRTICTWEPQWIGQGNPYDFFDEFAGIKRVVLLSLNEIVKSTPVNHSQHRRLVFSLPMRHVICPYQVLEAKFTKRGFWTLSHISMMRSPCLAWSATRSVWWRSSFRCLSDWSPPCAIGQGWSLIRSYLWASTRCGVQMRIEPTNVA